jgi:hypothetical protein
VVVITTLTLQDHEPQGKISGQDVVARFAAALGGRLHQAIYFDDGDIAAIA